MELIRRVLLWQFACYKAAKNKLRSYFSLKNSSTPPPQPQLNSPDPPSFSVVSGDSSCSQQGPWRRQCQTLVCDLHGSLLRTCSLFPFFMLVAFEGGSLLRAFLLLLLSPLLPLLGPEIAVRVMAFVALCGLRKKDLELVSRAVLPKFYLENLHIQACELLLAATGRRTVVTALPRLMVEAFLKEFLGVGEVVGTELQVVRGCYFTGLTVPSSTTTLQRALKDLFGDDKVDVGILSSSNPHHQLFIPYCKEIFVINEEEMRRRESEMPRSKYPKPLIFHDGRLAFLPTPSAMLALFMWLPVAVPLAVFRMTVGIVFPYNVMLSISALSGIRFRTSGGEQNGKTAADVAGRKGVLYVCTHRTLLDPVMLCVALQRAVPAVTYSLSRISEALAPMQTVRLTRDRERDAAAMRGLLRVGELAVCPEGTTCREPYLLRFSPLFAELAEEIVPVALDARVTMFYGTTASGHKWLDPVVFMMDPAPAYTVRVLPAVPREMTCAGGWGAAAVANRIQRQLAEALRFECTALTRRDKYMMLAGNEGVVRRTEVN